MHPVSHGMEGRLTLVQKLFNSDLDKIAEKYFTM